MSAAGHLQVARTERDLALDRALEQLLVGVLEDEPDGRREVRDGPLVDRLAVDQDAAGSPAGGGR